MAEPESKGERTRQEILAAAKELFMAQGYTATSMRQIARAVGITPAAIYNHFSGKEEIFTTLLRQAAPFEQVLALFHDMEADTPESVLQQLFRGIVEILAGREDYFRLAMIDAQEHDGATLTTFLPDLFPHMMSLYQRLAALSAAHGRLRDISPFLFARALFALVAGFLITERVVKPVQTLQLPDVDWIQGLAEILMYGMLTPPAEQEE